MLIVQAHNGEITICCLLTMTTIIRWAGLSQLVSFLLVYTLHTGQGLAGS